MPTACRHLNGGYPVLVGTFDHAFVLCGWWRDVATNKVRFVRHDDQQGPYLTVDTPLADVLDHPDLGHRRDYGPWRTMHVPMPDKAWLLPESAERFGGAFLFGASSVYAEQVSKRTGETITDLATLVAGDRLSLRTYVVAANDYKRRLDSRGFDDDVISMYRLARTSRYLVVVEAIDRQLRQAGKPAVVGEVIFDATSADTMPEPLASRLHGVLAIHRTDGSRHGPLLTSPAPVLSGGSGPP